MSQNERTGRLRDLITIANVASRVIAARDVDDDGEAMRIALDSLAADLEFYNLRWGNDQAWNGE